jgi:hypothetical protein
MRCLILGALVLIASTGCGGPSDEPVDTSSPRTDLRMELAARSTVDQAAIRRYLAAFNEEAVNSCVIAFDDENASAVGSPVQKPRYADLAGYLCNCLKVRTCL